MARSKTDREKLRERTEKKTRAALRSIMALQAGAPGQISELTLAEKDHMFKQLEDALRTVRQRFYVQVEFNLSDAPAAQVGRMTASETRGNGGERPDPV